MKKDNPATDLSNSTIVDWVKMYSEPLFLRAMFLTSNREASEDIVQETFLAATKGFIHFSGKSGPKTWLMSILHHKVADYFRHQFRMPVSTADEFFTLTGDWKTGMAPVTDWPEGDEHLLDNSEFQKILHQCLDDLPDIWRSAFLFKHLENKKGQAICQELGISKTNYWQILHRTKLQLRYCIEVHWFKS